VCACVLTCDILRGVDRGRRGPGGILTLNPSETTPPRGAHGILGACARWARRVEDVGMATRRRVEKRRSGGLTHLDARGAARMVDISRKPATLREAVAEGTIRMNAQAYAAVRGGALAKGDVVSLARVAAIGAAKRTADLIPLCHTVPLDHVEVDIRFIDRERALRVRASARTRWSTGVEMEAMVAVSAALLTVYDMAKALDRAMQLGPLRLLRKSGGRSGAYVAKQV